MAMAAAKSRQDNLPVKLFDSENLGDDDKKEVSKMVREFLDSFEADYRQKIQERSKGAN